MILSAGTRCKIVQYFKRALAGHGLVVAADMSLYAPALYMADRKYLVPRITDPKYLEIVLDICKTEQIQGVLSLIDPELSLLAAHREQFAAVGTMVIGSEYVLCERALDKMEMYRWLVAHEYSCAKSYTDMEVFFRDVEAGRIQYPVFVKPIRGSASISINKAFDRETVEFLFRQRAGLMIQEFLNGQEIGADCYIDMISGELVSVFTKKKLLMRAGETDKGLSFQDPELFRLIETFVKESGWCGPIDIDIFQVNDVYYISEVNPRFGGGYPHAYECGCDFMTLILENLSGRTTISKIGNYRENVLMMKYSEVETRTFHEDSFSVPFPNSGH